MATTPRDLDPKFKDESEAAKREAAEREAAEREAAEREAKREAAEREAAEREAKKDDDTPMIVLRQPITNEDGTPGEKLHGPMPVADWPAYEKEHNL